MAGVPRTGRRERTRAATVEEIKATARRLLVEQGPRNVTLRAIAREMGMTAPGLYRYFPSYEDLWWQLCSDTYAVVADVIEAAYNRFPVGNAKIRLLSASRAFRDWAVDHPREFELVFGAPLPGVKELLAIDPAGTAGPVAPESPVIRGGFVTPGNIKDPAGLRFTVVFAVVFAELWAEQPFPVPDEDDLPAGLAPQLRAYRDTLVPVLPACAEWPLGAVQVFLQAWVQLYGIVTMEVFGHLQFCLSDTSPFFESQLRALADQLGVTFDGPLPA
jgi:AcrR family transcriptional regulator